VHSWLPLVYAVVAIVLLPPVVRWFGLRTQRLVFVITDSQDAALYLHHFILLPGTILHEVAHWLTAKLLGVRTGKLSLMPVRQGNVARFGSVQIGATDPLRASLIGAAPLLLGTLAVVAIARWRFGLQLVAPLSGEVLRQFWIAINSAPDALLWLYLIISLANAMLPSPSDRRSWHWVGLGLLGVLAGLYLVGYLGSVAGALAPRLSPVLNAVTLVSLVTILCDLILGLLAFVIEMIIGSVFGRWVDAA
jgi:hypothetical protein